MSTNPLTSTPSVLVVSWCESRNILISEIKETKSENPNLASYLGAFAKLRKATISSVMSVCLSFPQKTI
jgi:hypothetical protein